MGVRVRSWAATVALFVLITLGVPTGVSALRCYKCNNCIKYELSQSQNCGPEDTHCMKMDMETGQVQRSCGTEEMCTNSEKELKTRYAKVSCCANDNCNSATNMAPGSFLMLMLLLTAVATAVLPDAVDAAARRLLVSFC